MAPAFPHESLDCCRLAVGIARWVAAARFPAGHAPPADQDTRAAQSIVLIVAEGAGRGGVAGKRGGRGRAGEAPRLRAWRLIRRPS